MMRLCTAYELLTTVGQLYIRYIKGTVLDNKIWISHATFPFFVQTRDFMIVTTSVRTLLQLLSQQPPSIVTIKAGMCLAEQLHHHDDVVF